MINTNMQLNLNFFNKVFSLLVSAIPLLLITGGFLPDVVVSITGFYFLVLCVKFKLWDYFKNKIIIFFFIFITYISLRGLNSIDIFHTFFTSIVYFRYFFFTLAIIYLIKNYKNFLNYLLLGSILSLFIIVPDTYFEWIFGKNIFGWEKYSQYRLSSFFRDELIVGAFIFKIYVLYFICYNKCNFKNSTLDKLFIPSLLIINFIIFASGERSAFLHIILFSLLIVTLADKKFLIIGRLKILIIFISIILSVIFIDKDIRHRMIDHTFNQLNEKTIPFLPYTIHHEAHYTSAIKMFMDKPLVGHGSGLFRFLCSEEKYYTNSLTCSTHPHNFYIQLLAENGLIAFIIFISFYFYLIKTFIKQTYYKKYNKEQFDMNLLFSSTALIVYQWPLIPTMDFFNQWSNIPLFIIFGLFLSNLKPFKNYHLK